MNVNAGLFERTPMWATVPTLRLRVRGRRPPSDAHARPLFTRGQTRSASGSVGVVDHGRFAGWLHASSGDTRNAFLPAPVTHLGKFTMEAAARVIVAACHARKAS
jgi:hypothetical protein